MLASLSTVDPPILDFVNAKLFEVDKPWAPARLPLATERVRERLRPVVHLGDADWLDVAFSAGDLMMASVRLRLRSSGLLIAPRLQAGLCGPSRDQRPRDRLGRVRPVGPRALPDRKRSFTSISAAAYGR